MKNYKALSGSCREGLWLRNLLHKLKIWPLLAIWLHVDNEGAEALAKNLQHHSRTKHIHTRFHFVWECVKLGQMSINHVLTKDMLADLLTNLLDRVLLEIIKECLEFLIEWTLKKLRFILYVFFRSQLNQALFTHVILGWVCTIIIIKKNSK